MIPVEQRCPKCGQMHMGSDVVGLPCMACATGLTYQPVIDYSKIEEIIIGDNGMDRTIFDLYGFPNDAVDDLRETLKSERKWRELDSTGKLAFQTWIMANAGHYKDNNRVDWIGAFYDWFENDG